MGAEIKTHFAIDKAKCINAETASTPADEWQSVCMLYIGYPADDFVPNTYLGGHRKPLEKTCFWGEVR